MLKMTEMILLLFIWLTGACVFSFADGAAWRISRKMDFLRGRSRCDFCGRVLNFWELIPVAGWILCRGRCRSCRQPIPLRHVMVEAAGGITALLCAGKMENFPSAVAMFGFLGILTSAALVDGETMEIPDGFHWAILGITAAAAAAGASPVQCTAFSRIAGAVCISLPMLLLTVAVPGAFGGGDIKLAAVCGLFLGWKPMVLAMILAVLSAGIWGGILLASGRAGRKDHFAFGPFFCGGIWIAVFWGRNLWTVYRMYLQI